MSVRYLPAGYSDSEEEQDFLDYPKDKSSATGGWTPSSFEPVLSKQEKFDQDIKDCLMSGDLGLVEQVVGELNLDINYHLSSAYGWSLALFSASIPEPSILRWLLSEGGQFSVESGEACPALVALASSNRWQSKATDDQIVETAQLILGTGEDLNSTQNQGKTGLMLAASYGTIALVDFLIGHGAELNLVDSQGWTALMFAADEGHGAVVRLLLEAGADPNLVSLDGQRAGDLAGSSTLQAVINQFAAEKGLTMKQISPLVEERAKEMENILIGLDLEEYKDVFRDQKITISEFLTLSDENLIELGIHKIGARIRLLEGQAEAHKRNWERGSMPKLCLTDKRAGLRLTCADTAGVLGNLCNHAAFLRASVAYVRMQLRDHRDRLLKAGSDAVAPSQLMTMLEESRKRVVDLEGEMGLLHLEFEIAGASAKVFSPNKVDEDPGDVTNWSSSRKAVLFALSVPILVVVTVGVGWRLLPSD